MPISIYIATKQNLFRLGLKSLMENDLDVDVVGMTDNGNECFDKISDLNPNIVILDVNLSEPNGNTVLRMIKNHKINVKTLMISDDTNMNNFIDANKLKCDGYILKNCSFEIFKKSIFSIYNGNRYIQDEFNNLILNNEEFLSVTDKLNELTKREIEVLKLIAEGLFNKEIANALNISERTVKNHVANIFKKIMVNDRTQAAVFAIKNGVISL